ncbi:hypothetical protein ASF13_18990 [Erwinia sp. Leaf53]|nr:hypothetical protein ASF13_18990 [Erwinia sp. Leaf53]
MIGEESDICRYTFLNLFQTIGISFAWFLSFEFVNEILLFVQKLDDVLTMFFHGYPISSRVACE